MESARFRSVGTEDHAPVQIASANGLLEMTLPQTHDKVPSDKLMMGNNALRTTAGLLTPAPYRAIPEKQVENLVADLLDSLETPVAAERPRYHVVHSASEMAPVAKVGGLGDVVAGLGRSIQNRGHRVEVIIPKYKCMDITGIKNFKVLGRQFYSYFDGAMHKNAVWSGIVEGLFVYFIDPLHPKDFFGRESIYNQPDDFDRFTYFSRAALEFLSQFGKRPNVIHLHDWPVAMVAPLYRSLHAGLGFNSRIAFTCHNIESQGKGSKEALEACGVQFKELLNKEHFRDNVSPDKINIMKSGFMYSDFVTTVSPTYAKEVLTPEKGEGLQSTIEALPKFQGILNGIDDKVWNPATDSFLRNHYSAANLKGKQLIKNSLRRRLRMAYEGVDAKRPLVCCVTRLVPQKGVHLIRHAIFQVLKQGGQFILQGTSQVPHIKEEFDELERQFQNHPHIRLVLRYEEELTHNIFAAADIFVIPSLFEPCGLTQMYAMRYGAIPVVRKTGGLADSVFDVDDESLPFEERNGFSFTNPDEEALTPVLNRAMRYYKERRIWWANLVRQVMRLDFSWDAAPVDQYIRLYDEAVTSGGLTAGR
jgi:ADP-glucose type glycogen/starch synthase